MYDVVLIGARVLDPGRAVDAKLDVAITGDRLVEVAPGIDGASVGLLRR